ncbi:unnamed protein product [Porites evermanni]|uniref:Uncharacterized protein n=1 Tax=Porites evermanni TaxID=104178 RepID=A0ABN8RJ59_9CNID|nr:unnamed protein product [Porites evermanni]
MDDKYVEDILSILKNSFQKILKKDTSQLPHEEMNSREILACRRQVLSREQREGERQKARVNTCRASEDDHQRERVRSRRRRQNFSEESRQVERVRARRRRENYSENAGKQNETELE